MGALFFNESSILRCLAGRVKHFLGAIFFYLASVILRVRWIDSVAVGCFEWLSDAAEAGDVVVSMAGMCSTGEMSKLPLGTYSF